MGTTAYIRECLVGSRIRCGTEIATLIRLGSGSAIVKIDGGQELVGFKDKNDVNHEYLGHRTRTVMWSLGTRVEVVQMPQLKRLSLRPVDDSVNEGEGHERVTPELKEHVMGELAKSGKSTGAAPKGVTPGQKKAVPAAKAKKAPKQKNPCQCGCGGETGGRFVPGHDARFYGWCKKIVEGKLKLSELGEVPRKLIKTLDGAKALLEGHKKH